VKRLAKHAFENLSFRVYLGFTALEYFGLFTVAFGSFGFQRTRLSVPALHGGAWGVQGFTV